MTKKRIWKSVGVVLLCLAGFWMYQSLGRSFGIRLIQSCPPQDLTQAEANEIYRQGVSTVERDKMGEYYLKPSLDSGLPLIYRAAIHGHRGAIKRYASHLTQAGIIDMHGINGLSSPDAAVESLMWDLVLIHLGESDIPNNERDAYQVLLEPSIPFPEGYFKVRGHGLGWMFQMMTEAGVNWARHQAWAWRTCWVTPSQ